MSAPHLAGRLVTVFAGMLGIGLLARSAAGQATYLYVRADASPGGDGFSWSTAFMELQDAWDAAAASGGATREVWVARGRYWPDRVRIRPPATEAQHFAHPTAWRSAAALPAMRIPRYSIWTIAISLQMKRSSA